jgi:UDP-GlcNAc:undecaprenyl-phosphate GlcNAc-1-phosphate transferase
MTPIMGRLASLFRIVDTPNQEHKTHSKPVPYLGGVAIAVGVILVTFVSLIIETSTSSNYWIATSVLAPALILGIVGLIDDIRNLAPLPRFLAQTLFGILIASYLIATQTLGTPLGFLLLDMCLSVLWIIGITNAINFFDNLDGGASGSVAISSLFLSILAWQGSQFLIAALSTVLFGATLGFLAWNRPPARIYMGDAGSLFLGVLISSLTLRFDPSPNQKYVSFMIPLLLLSLPILDTSVAITSRLRRGISPFQGGRDHLSHRLMRMGLPKKKALILLWCIGIFFCLCALLISNVPIIFHAPLITLAGITWLGIFAFFLSTADS